MGRQGEVIHGEQERRTCPRPRSWAKKGPGNKIQATEQEEEVPHQGEPRLEGTTLASASMQANVARRQGEEPKRGEQTRPKRRHRHNTTGRPHKAHPSACQLPQSH